jgi:uncharacterized protein YecT (DUF1311 family)
MFSSGYTLSTYYLLNKTLIMNTINNLLTLVSRLQSTMLLVILLLGSAVEGRCADTWLYQQPVVYSENHDPSMVYLDDGRQLQVEYGPEIEWEEVNKWQKGKKLFISYNSTNGTVLVDSSTGKTLPILSGLKEHPLEVLEHQRGKKDISTMDMVDTLNAFTDLWEKEMNRVLNALMTTVDMDGKRTIQDSQEAWKKFRDAEVKMLIKIHNEREGTIQRLREIGPIISTTTCHRFDPGIQ